MMEAEVDTTGWGRCLAELRAAAVSTSDQWLLLTAVGLGASGLDDACSEVDLIATELGLSPGETVIDLGCGVGRHTKAFQLSGFSAIGVDSSRELVDLGNQLLGVDLVAGDMRQTGLSGAFDLVTCLSDTMGIAESIAEVTALLRSARSLVNDNGRVCLQVSAWPSSSPPDDIKWSCEDSPELREQISQRALPGSESSLLRNHRFSSASGVPDVFSVSQTVLSMTDLKGLLERNGLRLDRAIDTGSGCGIRQPVDGQDVMILCSPTRPFNYVEDLESLIEAWGRSAHRSNTKPTHYAEHTNGRLTNSLSAQPGRGSWLTPHHDGFWSVIEPGVAPLVGELVEGWRFVTYSSCEGHRGPGSVEDSSDARVGLVDLHLLTSNDARLASLLRGLTTRANDRGARLELESGTLLSPYAEVPTLDVVVRRRREEHWDAYRKQVESSIRLLVDELVLARQGAARC